jgi:hypothetical protein
MQLMPRYGTQSRQLNYCYVLLRFLPAVRLRMRLLMPPGHSFTHSSGVLPWEEGGGRRRQERYSETALSEEHYSRGYLYFSVNKVKNMILKGNGILPHT